ncbi:MAG: amidohydrolase family protein [Clostridia bacterium]|nr:amidohydrolase family protein [Clostridia bacterium]
MHNYKLFDIHTHIWPDRLAPAACRNLGAFYNFPIEGEGTVSDLTESSLKNGVSGVLMLSVATNAKQVPAVNAGAAAAVDAMREAGLNAYAFAGFHQDCVNADEIVENAVSLGLSGFKLHPDIQGADIDDERFFPLYRECESRGLPLYFHMGDCRPQYRFSEIRRLIRIKEKFPALVTVAAHLGSYTAWEDSYMLKDIPNTLYDTSSALWAMSAGRAGELIHMLGVSRCMFGTDYPVKTADTEIALFEALELTDEERRRIAYDNAAAFLKF